MSRLHAAVDVGGTFIDVVVADPKTRRTRIAKVMHVQGAEGVDILRALEELATSLGFSLGDVDTVVIGTTVITNALLEGALARTALITTEGFRDVLEIARMARVSSYDLHRHRPPPLVPRHLRLEVNERLAFDGTVLCELQDESLRRHFPKLIEERVEAIAVSLLFSFVSPEHERRIRHLLAAGSSVPISLSSDVLPVFREYERTSTTVVNAATSPAMGRFVDGLFEMQKAGVSRVYIMGSDGGCLTLPEARRFPVRCMLSGPAGGVIGALRLASRHGFDDALTLDVGGTSTDVAMLRAGSIPFTDERRIAGYPVALPSVEVETIGAGGGSIAHLDRAGLLKVGPRSAGAEPGPACYQRGGTLPTVTDAHVALGRIGSQTMLDGKFTVNRDAAVAAIETHIAEPLGLNWVRAAQGILKITTANIVRAVRAMSVERGHDPRRLNLIAFGGAGPLHAIDVALALETPIVVVPPFPGVWSAFGILAADIQYAAHRTWFRNLAEIGINDLREIFTDIAKEIIARVRSDGLPTDTLRTDRALDLRYRGQSFTITVALAQLSADGLRNAEEAFHVEHERRYSHSAPGSVVELVNVRVTIKYPRVATDAGAREVQQARAAPEQRMVWFHDEEEAVSCPIYQRDQFTAGDALHGPMIVEQYDSTIVVAPGDHMKVLDDAGALMISIGPPKRSEERQRRKQRRVLT